LEANRVLKIYVPQKGPESQKYPVPLDMKLKTRGEKGGKKTQAQQNKNTPLEIFLPKKTHKY